MRLFEIPDAMYAIREAIERGEAPPVEAVNLLLKDGPAAVDNWFLAMDEVEAEITAMKEHVASIKGRMDRRATTLEKMKSYAEQVLASEFNGKVKTAIGTYWVQAGKTYDFVTSFVEHPELFKIPEPVLKKAELISMFKAGEMPSDICVTETETSSLRVRR